MLGRALTVAAVVTLVLSCAGMLWMFDGMVVTGS